MNREGIIIFPEVAPSLERIFPLTLLAMPVFFYWPFPPETLENSLAILAETNVLVPLAPPGMDKEGMARFQHLFKEIERDPGAFLDGMMASRLTPAKDGTSWEMLEAIRSERATGEATEQVWRASLVLALFASYRQAEDELARELDRLAKNHEALLAEIKGESGHTTPLDGAPAAPGPAINIRQVVRAFRTLLLADPDPPRAVLTATIPECAEEVLGNLPQDSLAASRLGRLLLPGLATGEDPVSARAALLERLSPLAGELSGSIKELTRGPNNGMAAENFREAARRWNSRVDDAGAWFFELYRFENCDLSGLLSGKCTCAAEDAAQESRTVFGVLRPV